MKGKENRYTPDKGNSRGLIRGMIKFMSGMTVCLVGLVLLSAGLAHSYHALLRSPWLLLQEIRIEGLHHLDRIQVLNAMKVSKDTSLIKLKMKPLAERIEMLPGVRSAVVRLDPPRRLVVEVEERVPLAVISADSSYLVDREGKLFLRVEREHYPELIALDGFDVLDLQCGDYLPLEPFETLQELHGFWASHDETWSSEVRVQDYSWDPVEGISFQLKNRSITVHLGSELFADRIQRLKQVLHLLEDREWLDRVKKVDLDFDGRAIVQGDFFRL